MQASLIEADLRLLLLKHPHVYQQHHNYDADKATGFIYSVNTYDELMTVIQARIKSPKLVNYALYRWFNRMVSEFCEYTFAQHPNVVRNLNRKHKSIDLWINGIPLDVKATVLPRDFSPADAAQNPRDVLNWYYKNQSGGIRHGINNRLFVAKCGYWYHKCDLNSMASQIDMFMLNYSSEIQKSTKITGIESGLILVA